MAQSIILKAEMVKCFHRFERREIPSSIAREFIYRTVATGWMHDITGDGAARLLRHAVHEALKRYPVHEFWEAFKPSRYRDGAPYREGILKCIMESVEEYLHVNGPDPQPQPDRDCPVLERLERLRAVSDVTDGASYKPPSEAS